MRLLPDYERAVHLSRLHEAEEDLRWAQQGEPGTYDTTDLRIALYRFRSHATAFIATIRAGTPLSSDQALFLDRMEDGLSLDALDDADTEALADAEAVWRSDGEALIEMARGATPCRPSSAVSASAISPGRRASALPVPSSPISSRRR
ncbi:hypothetical protein GPA10_37485 [Streptomyces sp. p1417]|uniref:Uncharacterized protein n=1 Tax=Streptomyces typhae TaxID=2681492 RepID=A0A6L6X8W9_9ACTN|nr:hypothetical protein [Streptomyces typhae]MVO90294.1 hypothetical protein [Streptomyces typhae]